MDLAGKSTITISTAQIANLSPATQVKELKKAIADKEGVDDVRLIYGGKQLSKDECSLSDYNIHNESTLFGVLRLLGGAQAPAGKEYNFTQHKVEKLKQIKIGNDIVNITVSNGKCGICWDNKPLATLHDGHSICATCMADQSRAKVFNGDAAINCPISCKKEIPSHVAFTVAGLDDDEWKEWEVQLNKNAICFKSCPNKKCGQFIIKEFKDQRVRCPKCKSEDFCWSCLKKWKGSDNIHCGNPECVAIAEALKALEESWNKRTEHGRLITNVKDVPEMRICPNYACLRINEHSKNCKHMTCKGLTGCKHEYCHVCLKKWKGCKCAFCEFNGGNAETCDGLGTLCKVHPLQKLQ